MTFPTRDQMIAQIDLILTGNRADFSSAVIDEVLLPVLKVYGSLNERERITETLTLASQSWMAAQRRQRDAIDRLLGENRDLTTVLAEVRSDVERLEAHAVDLAARYDALTSTTPTDETERG